MRKISVFESDVSHFLQQCHQISHAMSRRVIRCQEESKHMN